MDSMKSAINLQSKHKTELNIVKLISKTQKKITVSKQQQKTIRTQ